ncbi:MAG TPA: SlyX family protein [Candidatus Polarisedimenticolia bacterium]|nr:SlyX family protein [Candidatus Polarisedimenticolia bacterium]
MKTSKFIVTALALAALTAGGWAEDPPSAAPAGKDAAAAPAPPTVTAADVQALRDALAAQQLQIDRLTKQLERQQGQQSAMEAASKSDTRPVPQQQVAEVATGISVQQDVATPSPNPQDASPNASPMEGPLTIHFRGINITPGGYAEAAFVRRSRALSADLPTPFNSVTMPGASQSQVPEFFGSGRQSKITTFVNGRLKDVELSSYVSADFLSAGVTSTSTSTNSYTLRLRQAWAQAKFANGWSFLGGQAWSLATENGKGISPDDDLGRTNDVRPRTVDPSYNVGFVFTRQYGIRLTKTFGDKVAFAVAMENAQGTLTTHGNGDNFLLGQAGASNSYNTTSTYTFNPSPDLIAKVAFDPGFGHYEAFGLYDRFADRVFPCGEVASATTLCGGSTTPGPNSLGAHNTSKNGGGIGASARWNIAHRLTFGVKGFGGSGIGRYAPAGLSDVSINADGTLHLIKNLEGLTTLEWHSKKLDIYGYGGVEYAQRTSSFDPITGKEVGYGAPLFNNSGCYSELAPTVNTGFTPTSLSNCTSDTRAVIEGTAGFWYRFYNGPRGRFQFGTQYSYLTRDTWSGVGPSGAGHPGVTPEGVDNMVFTSFRYILP